MDTGQTSERKKLCKIITIAGITFAISLVLSCITIMLLDSLLLNKLTNGKADFLSVYYNYENAFPTADGSKEKGFNNLVLVDASVYKDQSGHDRLAIAHLLDTLYSLNPAAIGLDILFPDSMETTPEDDLELEQAVLRCKDKLVVAARNYDIVDTLLHHSFFTTRTGVDFGTVNRQSFNDFVLFDELKDGTKVDKFVVKLAKKAGMLIPEESLQNGLVDYRSKNAKRLVKHLPDQLVKKDIEGMVVLVGEFNDGRDYDSLPFKIDGESTLAGSYILAYQLSSILKPNLGDGTGHKVDNMLHRSSRFSSRSLFYNLFFLFLCAFVYTLLSVMEEELKGSDKRRNGCKYMILILLKPIILSLISFMFIWQCLHLVRSRSIVIDAICFFVGVIVWMEVSYKLASYIYKKK